MKSTEKLVSENYILLEKLIRDGRIKEQVILTDFEELLPELKSSIVGGDYFTLPFIQHPLVIGELNILPNSYYNNQLKKKQDLLLEFEKGKNFESYMFVIEKPFRVLIFNELVKQNKIIRNTKKYWKILSSIWTSSENIFQHKEIWYDLFKDKTNFHFFMNSKDLNFFNSLEDEFIVYRGYEEWEDGYSYSIDKDIAIWFAERFGRDGKVKERKVKKEDVFAFTNSRKEKEIIIFNNNWDL
jgi:hypothetical protein